jgi:hypothetical protein
MTQYPQTRESGPPRFGPLAVGGYARITAGVHEGYSGEIAGVPSQDTLMVCIGGSILAVPQQNAEPAPRPAP